MSDLINPVPATSPNWHPIATGPRDGTRVLLFYPNLMHAVQVGFYASSKIFDGNNPIYEIEEWVCATTSCSRTSRPTHWMPLPAEPQP